MSARNPIYLDHHATTPVDPRVLDVMLPFFAEDFGNAASVIHAPGRRAAAAVDDARERIAAVLGAEPREIVFTSGATEANNLALQGSARLRRQHRDHLVTVVTEHPAQAVFHDVLATRRLGWSRCDTLNIRRMSK